MDVHVGNVRITRVEESLGPGFKAAVLLPDWQPELMARHAEWLIPSHFDPASGRFILSVHAWLVRTPDLTVLVDTGCGDAKERPDMPAFHRQRSGFLDRLRAAGVAPADIDVVVCTHLHVDHVGWNTHLLDGLWVPTFPKARYMISRIDHDFYHPMIGPGTTPSNARVFADSVQPVIDAGLLDLVAAGDQIGSNLAFVSAPGHSPGQLMLQLTAGDNEVLFTGDLAHHPIQISEPHLSTRFCVDGVLAAQTRRAVFTACAERRTLLCPGHFAAPFMGRVTTRGDGFQYHPGFVS